MKAICIDDEKYVLADMLQICSEIEQLEDVKGFRTCISALEYLRDNEVDIIFLDIDMPDVNGLDFAKQIKNLRPQISIIFTTGYSQYAIEAFKTRAYGYLLKPVSKVDIIEELNDIIKSNKLNKTEEKTASSAKTVQPEVEYTEKIFAKTFGNFELFVNGQIVTFSRKKAKELLAYLIDRQGSSVTRKEIAAVLFEDEIYSRGKQSYITKIVASLSQALESAGISYLLIKEADSYAVNTKCFSCDSYEFLEGNSSLRFPGEYMSQYSWSEDRITKFFS